MAISAEKLRFIGFKLLHNISRKYFLFLQLKLYHFVSISVVNVLSDWKTNNKKKIQTGINLLRLVKFRLQLLYI